MTDIYHQPAEAASPAHVDPDNLALRLTTLTGWRHIPGMLLRRPDWPATKPVGLRVEVLDPSPGTRRVLWVPVLSDAATAGVLLDWLALEADGVGCERLRTDGGGGVWRWCVTAHRAGELRAAEHEDLGVAVALVLLTLGGAL